MKHLLPLVAALLCSACSPRAAPDADAATTPPPTTAAPAVPVPPIAPPSAAPADTGTLARLEREARAMARTEGCSGPAACRVAPVGSRPCGGPRTYLPYCAATTDTAALFRKLDELKQAEEAFNQASGTMSTCEFRTPPVPTWSGGRCGTGEGNAVP